MKRDIDWGLVLRKLLDMTEETGESIAKRLKTQPVRIIDISNDERPAPNQWNQAVGLLDLYLEYFEPTEVPRVGDYYESESCLIHEET